MKLLEFLDLKSARPLPEGSLIDEAEREQRIYGLQQASVSCKLEGLEGDIDPDEAELIGAYVDGLIDFDDYMRRMLRLAYEKVGELGEVPKDQIEQMIDDAMRTV